MRVRFPLTAPHIFVSICKLNVLLRYLSSVKISTQRLFMLALAMIVIGFLGVCLFIYYIFIYN
ncbi:UNVERIFIED_CONTAM: hypothetical protein DQE83_23150 [Escherichia coli]